MSIRPDLDAEPTPAATAALSPGQEQAFLAQARRLGHHPQTLLAGRGQTSRPVLSSVAAVRALVPATPEQRARRQAVFFSPSIALRRSIGQGVHDRLEAAVFADGTIDADDEAGAMRHFPFPAKAYSILRRTVPAGDCWDVSVRAVEFGVDDRDDLLVAVNVGVLVLEPGASVVVRGNLLVLVVQRLVVMPPIAGDDAPADFSLGILPIPFSVDPRRNRDRAPAGPPGLDGRAGADGIAAPITPTFIGPRLQRPPTPGEAQGGSGTDGTAGTDGASGASGAPSKIADVTVNEVVGTLLIHAGAGSGLDGGPGGAGGDGGAGGHGAPAVAAVGQHIAAGSGGHGGRGGDGGRGGRGGGGGISSNVFVTVPADQADRVRVRAVPSSGGEGGAGGRGGAGGLGGRAGGGDSGGPAEPGSDGTRGKEGTPGKQGRARPAPPIYINEHLGRNT